ncbi:MAG: DNA translocase FtsK 4TM domain-containing protein [Desulfoprunum sp.]|nr:DNA translocase FtsK 4TM domain-containing protein [Desulfoprunum sp.]
MAASPTEKNRPGFTQESLAVLGIFLAAFLFLSLLSRTLASEKNWCGEIGAFISHILISFTGWGAYLFSALLFIFALFFFSPRMSFNRLPHVSVGLTGAIVSFCGLLSALSMKEPSLIEAGGFLGRSTFSYLGSFIGGPGAILFLVLVFLISLMLSTQFSPYQLVRLIWRIIRGIFLLLFGRAVGRQEVVLKNEGNRAGLRSVREPRPVVDIPVTPVATVPLVKEPPKPLSASNRDEKNPAKPLARGDWELPPLSLLDANKQVQEHIDKEIYYKISQQLEQQLGNFGVSGKVIGISPGPVVTTYEYAPAPGIKINKIVGLADDIALGLRAISVRVVGSVPGKAALGIEIPNEKRQIVYIRDLIGAENYRKNSDKLSIALGLDVVGSLAMANLAKMPHLLIAGATGAGKSVGINTIIASILFNATPAEVRFLMIDPKRIELSGYEGIPHLLHPVVVDPRLASRALNWAVREMERRYRLLEEAKVKSFDSYNEHSKEKLPYIVVIVDELADLMMVASKDVETAIARLAQMARAAGIHLILATQRPSVDVLTGLIKANFPTRISFKVSSKIDSRTILDASGAEHLLGAGDMLLLAPGTSNIKRIHGAYISEAETSRVVEFLKKQGSSVYDESIIEEIESDNEPNGSDEDTDFDERYDEAVAIVTESGQASISMIQRRLRVGYNRAARMIETMEQEGLIGPADGAKAREVLVRNNYT